MGLFKTKLTSSGKGHVRFEVVKMAFYVYIPIFLYWSFNTDFFQNRFYLPYLKEANPDLYKLKTGLDPKDAKN